MILVEKLGSVFKRKKIWILSTFKKFKAIFKKESDHNIKTMKSNRGGKFTSEEFEEYYENSEICWRLTIVYSHNKNSVVERKIKSFLT